MLRHRTLSHSHTQDGHGLQRRQGQAQTGQQQRNTHPSLASFACPLTHGRVCLTHRDSRHSFIFSPPHLLMLPKPCLSFPSSPGAPQMSISFQSSLRKTISPLYFLMRSVPETGISLETAPGLEIEPKQE